MKIKDFNKEVKHLPLSDIEEMEVEDVLKKINLKKSFRFKGKVLKDCSKEELEECLISIKSDSKYNLLYSIFDYDELVFIHEVINQALRSWH